MTVTEVTTDRTFLGSIMANMEFWGVVGDELSPPINGSMEVVTDEHGQAHATVVLNAIIGKRGEKGENAKVFKMQYEQDLDSASELPQHLTNTIADIGKAWWIDNVVYAWSGTNWFPFPLGVPGPVGKIPEFTWNAELVPSRTLESLTSPIEVVEAGNNENPSMMFRFDKDSITGPPGPINGPLRDAADFDNKSNPRVRDGEAIIWDVFKQKWRPSPTDMLRMPCYSVPEGSFQSITNSTGSNQQVCTFAIPPQPFPWRPAVFGNIAASQAGFFHFFQTPMNLGCSVTLGDPSSGVLIARGFGNVTNMAFIFPHFSTPGSPGNAATPVHHGGGLFGLFDFGQGFSGFDFGGGFGDVNNNYFNIDFTSWFGGGKKPAAAIPPASPLANTTAVVPANHIGGEGTIYVTITNDGALGSWRFNRQDAQLTIFCMPVAVYVPQVGLPQRFSGRGSLVGLAEGSGGS